VMQLEHGLVKKISAIPGVRVPASRRFFPLIGNGWHDPIYARDKTYSQSLPPIRSYKIVSPGLLATLGNRLVTGAIFTWTDVCDLRNSRDGV